MKVRIHCWIEASEAFKTTGIKTDEEVVLTDEQMEQVSDQFDLMIRHQNDPRTGMSEKVMHVSPRGRGFGQRG